jgi:hypothetical protein
MTRLLIILGACALVAHCRTAPEAGSKALETPPAAAAAGAPTSSNSGCLFGADLEELESSPDFVNVAAERGVTVPSRRAKDDRKPRLFSAMDYRNIKTGRLFTVYSLYQEGDESFEGPTMIGWIEAAATGDVVAEIEDLAFTDCKVSSGTVASRPAACLFGFELSDLEETRSFSIKKLPSVTRVSRHDPNEKRPRLFSAREVTHLQHGQTYRVYNTAATDKEGQLGWIENQSGQVMALIGDGEIYKCAVNGSGVQVRALADDGRCGFGEDLHDLEVSDAFKLAKRGDVVRRSRITGDDERQKSFSESEATHLQSGKTFLVFNTFKDEDDGGNTIGWVEAVPSGEIVAEIEDSGFYNCRF